MLILIDFLQYIYLPIAHQLPKSNIAPKLHSQALLFEVSIHLKTQLFVA